MEKFQIQIGVDARAYYSTEIQAHSLKDAMLIADKIRYQDSFHDMVWSHDGFDRFDHIETKNITDSNGNIVSSSDCECWNSEHKSHQTIIQNYENANTFKIPQYKPIEIPNNYTVVFECFDGSQSNIYKRDVTADNKSDAIYKAYETLNAEYSLFDNDEDIENLMTDNVMVFEGHIDSI